MSIGTITSIGKIESNKSSVNLTYKRLCRYNQYQPTDKVQSYIITCDESVNDLSSLKQFMLLYGSKFEQISSSSEEIYTTIPLCGCFPNGSYIGVCTTLFYSRKRSLNPDTSEWKEYMYIAGYRSNYNEIEILSPYIDGSDWWIEDL